LLGNDMTIDDCIWKLKGRFGTKAEKRNWRWTFTICLKDIFQYISEACMVNPHIIRFKFNLWLEYGAPLGKEEHLLLEYNR